MAAEKKPMGRPSKYRQEFAEQAFKLCLLGATHESLADFFKVRVSTICEWNLRHKEFSEALKAGKDAADSNVAKSLYHRAIGYSCPETKVFNNGGEILTHEVIRHFPPDTTAAIFWLKNRQSALWRDRQVEAQSEDKPIEIRIVDAVRPKDS